MVEVWDCQNKDDKYWIVRKTMTCSNPFVIALS